MAVTFRPNIKWITDNGRMRMPVASSNPQTKILPHYKPISANLPLEIRYSMLAKQLTQPFHRVALQAVTERCQQEPSVNTELVLG